MTIGNYDPPPSRGGRILDERTRPDFRELFGHWARRATRISVAVTRVRLSTVDLGPHEVSGPTRLRVLLAEVNALTLDAEARVLHAHPGKADNVRFLTGLLEEGHLAVRSAPLAGWSPDFTVFEDASGPFGLLTGFHWFERPFPHRGPALSAALGAQGATLALGRYNELWNLAHDIGPAVWSILARAASRAVVPAVRAG